MLLSKFADLEEHNKKIGDFSTSKVMFVMKMPKKVESEEDASRAISAYQYRQQFRNMRNNPKMLFKFFQDGLTQELVD